MDSLTQKGAKLYYAFENHKQESDAKGFYDLMKSNNSQTTPVTNLEQIGDEGFLAKGPFDKPIIYIRKGKKIYILTLTWLTTPTSLDELLKIAKKVVTSP